MNIIVCFSWLGNNSLSEKQVLFLLQLHILGLIFGKVRHGALGRAVPGAFFLLLQSLLRGVLLDVLCMGRERKHRAVSHGHGLQAGHLPGARKRTARVPNAKWAHGDTGLVIWPQGRAYQERLHRTSFAHVQGSEKTSPASSQNTRPWGKGALPTLFLWQ